MSTQKGKIGEMLFVLADHFKFDPLEARDVLLEHFPQLNDKTTCANCGASLKLTEYSPDILDALLLKEMANEVRKRRESKLPLPEANFVHVPTLATTDAIRHRTTRCSYLGFIDQPAGSSNTGNWSITELGWQALAGLPVPKTATYYRGELKSRGDDTITLSEMFDTHRDLVQRALERRKQPRSDHVDKLGDYNPADWVEYTGYSATRIM